MPRTRLGTPTKDLKTPYGEQRLAVWSMKVMRKEVHWGQTHQTSKDSLWGTEVSGVAAVVGQYESYAKRGALGARPPNL